MNKHFLIIIAGLYSFWGTVGQLQARDYVNPNAVRSSNTNKANYRAACTASRSQTDLNINNVRARLRGGGDMWWDGVQAQYIVPNVDPSSGEVPVSALFSGAIWLGAYDAGNNLIVAAQTYRDQGNDYWSGPLNPSTAEVTNLECERWDKHFTVYGKDIDALRADFLDPLSPGIDERPSKEIMGWPARGNVHFAAIHGFDIVDYKQDLAPFIDVNADNVYNPMDGDHPVIEVTGCDKDNYSNPVYADQMVWWVYNDNGNLHTQSKGQAMQMEIQALAFAYSTTDAVNNMTFYRYKLLNRNSLTLKDTYFSLWSDPDLGCFADDYIGCDTATGLGYVYNDDAYDDNPCGTSGFAGYGDKIPALGVDYFKGPIDSFGKEIGLSGFQYHVGGSQDPVIGDPTGANQYYNLMSGKWLNGAAVTVGGNGYNPNLPNAQATRYVFPSSPDSQEPNAWSMCSENLSGLDQRFLHTSGPFVLKPGATNEMISGVVWVPELEYRCPSIKPLLEADQLAQNLFDGCFRITNGPDAPHIEVVEMDQELVLNLHYDNTLNNDRLTYEEAPAELTPYAPLDTTYNFQGYKIYQVNGPNVSVTELDDEEKARLIYQCDVEDDIAKIANWDKFTDTDLGIDVAIPTIKVEGENKGVQHTFRVTEDAFATGENTLINHKSYYYCVVAYAYNNYEEYDPITNLGQAKPYLQGRRNFRIYTAIPRINDPEYNGVVLTAAYGDAPRITRLEGQGASKEFLRIANRAAVEQQALAGENVGVIQYEKKSGPFGIKVVDPLRVTASDYQLHVCDARYTWSFDSSRQQYVPQFTATTALSDSIYWVLTDKNDPTTIWTSYQTLNLNYEQYIPDLGISITAQRQPKPSHNNSVGFVGVDIVYDKESEGEWYQGLEDGEGIYNMLKTAPGEDDHRFDPEQLYATAKGGWYPFMLCDAERRENNYYLSLGSIASSGARFRNDTSQQFNNINIKVRDTLLSWTNNVNVVLTPDQSQWSRCVVVESANIYYNSTYLGAGVPGWKIPSGRRQMEWRGSNRINTPTYYSKNKDGSEDQNSKGMSWFPGYAYDVETGARLNVFFGENSVYNGTTLPEFTNTGVSTGDDMLFNPSSTRTVGQARGDEKVQLLQNVQGGQHMIYVTRQPYDSCKSVIQQFNRVFSLFGIFTQDNFLYLDGTVTWASLAVPTKMNGPLGHIPPSKATIQLRVNRPYEIEEGTNQNLGYPLYEFALDGLATRKEENSIASSALDLLRVVPNPYYGYSDYEITEADNLVKIINIPAACKVTIYSLDGRLVRAYDVGRSYNHSSRNGIARIGQGAEGPKADTQILTSLEWNLENYAGVPVSSGVYLIHVHIEGVGTRVLKSFIINRALDAQRL
ncbi:MAG: hypothetical protein AB8E82_11885 [Aureispira sp.]